MWVRFLLSGTIVITFAAGVLLLAAALRRRRKCTARAVGRVVDFSELDGVSDYQYAPIVEFQADGRPYRVEPTLKKQVFGPANRGMQRGDPVTVYYNPSDPRMFVLGNISWNVHIMFGLALLLTGGMLAAVTIVLWYMGILR